ncbi:MAG TPA: alanine dehydrogenase [Cytophagales bacterium]|jgi:alanine dehydrogenase|nr:alanine dehydrogenase [Cytophagales bacterium]
MTDKPNTGFEELAKESQLYPQESMVKIKKGKKSLFIGIPKETDYQENRLALTPGGVEVLVNNGHEIWLESEAGKPSNYSDSDFSEAGARIIYSKEELYKANVVLKVEPPNSEEINLISSGSTLISALQLTNIRKTYIDKLNKKKITAIGYELIEDKVGGMPVVRAMSEIAGCSVMSIAADYLSSSKEGKGILLGGITGVPPTKVVILGAGTVAEYACRSALGLGAEVQVFDNHLYKLRRLKHIIGQQIYTSSLDSVRLLEALKSADVVIGAIRLEKGRQRFFVPEEWVSQMKPGAVIIDVSIDQGGCFETSEMTTHLKPVFSRYGIVHYCVPNIASRVARTATAAFSNIFTPIFVQAAEAGGIEEMIYAHSWFLKGIYTFKGNLTNADMGRKLNMPNHDLNILLAPRF